MIKRIRLFMVLCIVIAFFGCQSGDNQSSSAPSINDQDVTQAKKQLEEMGIEVSDQMLMERAENGDIETVKLLLKAGIRPGVKNLNNVTPLMFAVTADQVETVKLLIEFGAKLDIKDGNGDTALIRAAKLGRTIIALALIEAGSDINLKGSRGRAPLMETVIYGDIDILNALIQAGVDLNAKDNEGNTALKLAEKFRKQVAERILIDAGAKK